MSDPGQFTILTLPGDGIGREVTAAAVAVLQATGLPLRFSEGEAGWACFERTGVALPDATLDAARAADAVLFGAVASPSHAVPGYRSPIVALRRALGLYANIRPTVATDDQSSSFVLRPSSSVDLVVVRENTEDLYIGRERLEDDGATAIAERLITRAASERITRAAYELARQRANGTRQGRVTIVHKANVLRVSDGLFRETALGVAAQFPDVATDELLVDNAAMQLVLHPERFDVLVTTNMFGDILSDVACVWGGGLGLAVSSNIGDRHALFEPVHGAAPDIVGRGIANPLAAIGCAALLLDWLAGRSVEHASALRGWAERVRAAAARTLAEGPRTPDLGGDARTTDVTEAIISYL